MSLTRLTLAALLVAAPAWSAPGVPAPVAPLDGGWCARVCELTYRFSPFTPETVAAVLEVRDGVSGAVVATRTEAISTPPTDEWTTPSLPDAGFFTWRVRGLDDAGALSTWSNEVTFVVDGIAPAVPATLQVELDGGFLRLTTAAIDDLESGRAFYHYGVSRIDQADGSVSFGDTFNITSSGTTRDLFLGPGTYFAGAHAHDRVDNIGTTLAMGPLVVAVSPLLPTPAAPEPVRSDGGAWPLFPFINTDQVRLRVDAGAVAVTSWAFSSRPASGGDWEYLGFGPGPEVQLITLPLGLHDVRVALVSGVEVSAWSAPVRVHVDQNRPLSLTLTARVDGGSVELSWPLGRDTSTGASGVREYVVTRSTPDASVTFPRVPNPATGPVVFTDAPGFGRWSWSVRSIDFAGNVGTNTTLVTDLPPPRPSGLTASPLVTRLPIELSWLDDRDGGFEQVWSLRRLDALDASVDVAVGVTSPALSDDAPEGRWAYELFASVAGVPGEATRLDGVVRDVTPPLVSAPQLTRLSARTVEVQWSAMDALSGLDTVVLERDQAALGPQSAPFLDTPPDGLSRYRVVATDLAGNVATSEWSGDFVSPGPGLVLEALAPRVVTCGERLEVPFVANEPAVFSVLNGPEGASVSEAGFTWTPSANDVGTFVFTVRAENASGADEREWGVEVRCERLRPTVGCGCQSLDVTLGALVLVLARRRRR